MIIPKIKMSKLKLDLHDIFNNSKAIETSLEEVINEAVEKKIKTIEIIPGKGSGQLKKRVLRFLELKYIKEKIHRIDKDSKNFGRLFVFLKP
jgi:dsDNA-specific endonuclease/ATPase MutS2